jgi:hypothetical protein
MQFLLTHAIQRGGVFKGRGVDGSRERRQVMVASGAIPTSIAEPGSNLPSIPCVVLYKMSMNGINNGFPSPVL